MKYENARFEGGMFVIHCPHCKGEVQMDEGQLGQINTQLGGKYACPIGACGQEIEFPNAEEAAAMKAGIPVPSNAQGNQWFYNHEGAQIGPTDEASIVQRIQLGELPSTILVCKVGEEDWQIARNHGCFQVEIHPPGATPAPPPQTNPAAKPVPPPARAPAPPAGSAALGQTQSKGTAADIVVGFHGSKGDTLEREAATVRRMTVKTILHADCGKDGKDEFDDTVSKFLSDLDEDSLLGVHPVHTGDEKTGTDFGVVIIYKTTPPEE